MEYAAGDLPYVACLCPLGSAEFIFWSYAYVSSTFGWALMRSLWAFVMLKGRVGPTYLLV